MMLGTASSWISWDFIYRGELKDGIDAWPADKVRTRGKELVVA
jgi:hypothetical protein